MGLGPQLYGVLGPDSRLAIRQHVVAVEDVLRGILEAGIADATFTIEDVVTDDVPHPRMPEPAAPPGADDRVVRPACGGCRGLGVSATSSCSS